MKIPVTVYEEVKDQTNWQDLPVSMGSVAAGEADVVREGDRMYLVSVIGGEEE